MVEPLPLVPATWMTGGTRRSRMAEPLQHAPHPLERQVDALGMQREQPRQDGIDGSHLARRHSAWARAGSAACAAPAASRRARRDRLGHRRAAQQPAEPRERRAQFVAMHHHVDHAVVLQILGALEAVGQFLADGLLDHARAGEADQRAGLRDVHVAEHRVGRRDAAGGRIGQHHDVGLARLAQHFDRHGRARHLHQREDAFLHARAAGGREHDEGRALLDGGLQALDHRLARRHAERAAHEVEILHADDDAAALRACRSRA